MRQTLMLSAAAVAALSLAACNKPASPTADNAASATSDAASSAASATRAAMHKAEDATGAAVGATSANTLGSHDTPAFVSNASQSDMYEVQAAQIAEKRSHNKDIVAFAKMMEKDHAKSTRMMTPLVAAAGQKPADKLDDRRQGFIDHLNQASDADFDKVYVDQQVAAHKEALDLMQGYAKDGSDAGLKGGAASIAPTVQMHLDHIQKIQAAVKN